MQIEKPLQRHGGRLDHNETYCGSCFGAEAVRGHVFCHDFWLAGVYHNDESRTKQKIYRMLRIMNGI